MNPTLKPLLHLLLGGLLLSLVSFVIWITVNGSHQNILFGRVVDVTTSTITIVDRQNDQKVISFATSTSITRTRNKLSITDIEVDNFVQITVSGDGENMAESVRLMRPPHENNNHDSNH